MYLYNLYRNSQNYSQRNTTITATTAILTNDDMTLKQVTFKKKTRSAEDRG